MVILKDSLFCKYRHFYILSTLLSDKGDQNVLSNYSIEACTKDLFHSTSRSEIKKPFFLYTEYHYMFQLKF